MLKRYLGKNPNISKKESPPIFSAGGLFYYCGLSDALIASGSLAAAEFFISDTPFLGDASRAIPGIFVIYLLIYFSNFSGKIEQLYNTNNSLYTLHYSILMTFLSFTAVGFLLKESELYSRLVILSGLFASLFICSLNHIFISRLAAQIIAINKKNLFIVADNLNLNKKLFDSDNNSFVRFDELCMNDGVFPPETIIKLGEIVDGYEKIVVLCEPGSRLNWATALRSLHVSSEIIIPELGSLRPIGVGQFGESPSLVIAGAPLSSHQRVIKRLMDIVISIFALIILSPLMLIVWALIRLESPGPAIFRQERLGLGNRPFILLKFRSMRTELEDIHASKLTDKNDPRVTKVGSFIRKTSIDELPQLFNVLSGRMSVVGPRPHAVQAKAGSRFYWEIDKAYWHRHSIKPGMTGLAQVRGHRGNTFTEESLLDRLSSDLEYRETWSIRGDLSIIFATFGSLFGKNAF